MKRLIGSYLFLVLISLPLLAIGQEKGSERPEPARASSGGSYKVDVLLSENEGGKRINTRAYTFVVESGRTIRLRQGLRVPVVTGTGGNTSQFQFVDVGLAIDCEVAEVENGVRVNVSVDESSVATEQHGVGGQPVIRQFKDGGMAVIPLGKQTLLSSVEELDSKKRLDIEATVNKLH
ncbi:MAG TPA: hypothetical protein VF493_12765 [Terriglobales bacterium]